MSWFDFRRGRALLALSSVALLSGCLHPMYGGVAGRALVSAMQSVEIVPIKDRLGHYLHNDLIFAFNGTGASFSPRYRLSVIPVEQVQTPLVDTITGRATAGTVVVDANYRLVRISDGALVASGTAFTAAVYDRSSPRFADIRAARDAEIRDASSLSDQIRIRVAAALAAQNP